MGAHLVTPCGWREEEFYTANSPRAAPWPSSHCPCALVETAAHQVRPGGHVNDFKTKEDSNRGESSLTLGHCTRKDFDSLAEPDYEFVSTASGEDFDFIIVDDTHMF